ncbi:MAG TPA: radical SAM protein [Verrucomicrobiae bacterium]|nr:radical SAM protein [Verrucomicrobiae bacterium]
MNDTSTSTQPLLRYQRDRTLDQVPGLGTGLQVRLDKDRRAYIALSPCELVLYFNQPEHALHYDLEGRLLKISTVNLSRRRGLSHRVLMTHKRTSQEGGGIERTLLMEDAADAATVEARAETVEVLGHLNEGVTALEFGKPSVREAVETLAPLLEAAAHFNVVAARASAQRFSQIYGRVAVLPPDQYNALVLQATEGCAYGSCLFCELYKGVFYSLKETKEFDDHVREAVRFHGEGLRARRSIFLGEANALALPQDTLLEFFKVLNKHFELPPAQEARIPARWWLGSTTRFDGVSSFLDLFTGKSRSTDEYCELHKRGLRRVYIGLETGSNELSRWLCKPGSAEQAQRRVRALKEAGISVGVIVLLGAGGEMFDAAHRRETARVLNELSLGAGDSIYFSPLTIFPDSEYEEQTRALSIRPLSPQQLCEQEQAIRAALQFDAEHGRPYIARYSLETFLY